MRACSISKALWKPKTRLSCLARSAVVSTWEEDMQCTGLGVLQLGQVVQNSPSVAVRRL